MNKKHIIENITKTELEQLIDEHIIGFKAERNRSILKHKLIIGLTYEETAEVFDMSVMQIKNIVYKGEEQIAKHIEVRA